MTQNKQISFRWIKDNLFFLGLLFFSAGLSVSKTFLTVGGIILFVHFFLDLDIIEKFKRVFSKPLIWPFIAFYFLHVVGLIYSEDMQYALTDLRVKLPILFLPIFLSEAPNLDQRRRSSVFGLFIIALLIGSLIAFRTSIIHNIHDPREIVRFNSHIRFSIILCFGIFLVFISLLKEKINTLIRAILFLALSWMIYFLFFKAALSGRIISIISFALLLLIYSYKRLSKKGFSIIVAVLFIGVIGLLWKAKRISDDYLVSKETILFEDLPKFTSNGNPYNHSIENKNLINGFRMGYFICDKEIRENWSNYSDMSLDHSFDNATSTYEVLIRYLTSKGHTKDKVGLSKLDPQDISKIEKGIDNVHLNRLNDFNSRVFGILWGYQNYKLYGFSRGSSLMQRIELWNLSVQSIRDNPMFGVGTGDAVLSFNQLKKNNQSSLEGIPLRTHNQFLAVFVALGILGLLIFIWMIFYPPIKSGLFKNYYFMSFQIIFILSLFTENTLETQVGASFYSFFTAYFLFIHPRPMKLN